jgi:ABC-type branched-subunit amino acid transport system substrate-binding protein
MERRITEIAVLLAVLATTRAAAAEQGVTGDAILIGMEGETKSFAVDEENRGMRLVIAEVNERGGIHGRRLVERSYPRGMESAPEQEFLNAKRLVEEDGVFLLFNFGGPASLQIGPYATEKKIPYLFPHTALLTRDGARYIFTSFPRYAGESLAMLRYLSRTRGFRRIAVIHDPNVYGRFFLDRARELAGELGYEFVGSQAIEDARPAEATSEMRELRRSTPDAVIMALYPAQAKKVMEAKAALGWSEVRMVSSGPLTDEQYLDQPGGHSEGTLGFCHYPDPNEGREPGIAEYRELMKKHYPGTPLNRYSLYGYVFGNLVVEGLRRAGPQLTRETLIDALESIRDWESGGILPPVSFSKTNHHAQRAGFICELKDGRFRPLTEWSEP